MTTLTTGTSDWPICIGLYLVIGVMIYLLMWAAMPQEGKDELIGSYKKSETWHVIAAAIILITIWFPFTLWFFVIKGVLLTAYKKMFK